MLVKPLTPINEADLANLNSAEKWSFVEAAVWAHRPELSTAIWSAMGEMRKSATLSPRLLELLRLRIQFHNQCRACMTLRYSPEVDEDVVCSLERPSEAPDLAPGEKAALRFADLFVLDHLSIGEPEFEELRQYFDEGQIVELVLVCGLSLGLGRIPAVWRLYDAYPMSEWPDANEKMAPWSSGVHIDVDFSDIGGKLREIVS